MNTRIRVMLLPKDTNPHGNIFGGVLLSYIDLAAAEEARYYTMKRSNGCIYKFVTKIFREVNFVAPVHVGETVSFYTDTIATGKSSVTVKVEVKVGIGSEEKLVTTAEVVMVSVDQHGRKRELP